MARAPLDILAGLQTLMAELTASMQESEPPRTTTDDISPKLAKALKRETMPTTSEVPLKSHDEIRQQARAYKPTDYSGTMADYKPADDPDHDNSWALGTGDRKLIE
jgi:hypothetical protein